MDCEAYLFYVSAGSFSVTETASQKYSLYRFVISWEMNRINDGGFCRRQGGGCTA